MDERYTDNQPELIHCEFCGEDYAATYRACPFCDTAPNGKKMKSGSGRKTRAGDRVHTNTRGGGYGGARSPLAIAGIVLSVLLILAAVVIIAFFVKSMLKDMKNTQVNPSSAISSVEDQNPDADQPGDGAANGGDVSAPVPPDAVTLDQTELSLTPGATAQLTATLTPENWVGQVIWSTSNPEVATVNAAGNVTTVGAGTCTITAAAAGVTAECTVTCAEATVAEPGQSTIVLSCYDWESDDFTLKQNEEIPLKAAGGNGESYTFEIADSAIATVSTDGNVCTVKGLSAGKTKLIVTSGMEKVEVIIRVKAAG